MARRPRYRGGAADAWHRAIASDHPRAMPHAAYALGHTLLTTGNPDAARPYLIMAAESTDEDAAGLAQPWPDALG
jgi:hypothetical protein